MTFSGSHILTITISNFTEADLQAGISCVSLYCSWIAILTILLCFHWGVFFPSEWVSFWHVYCAHWVQEAWSGHDSAFGGTLQRPQNGNGAQVSCGVELQHPCPTIICREVFTNLKMWVCLNVFVTSLPSYLLMQGATLKSFCFPY